MTPAIYTYTFQVDVTIDIAEDFDASTLTKVADEIRCHLENCWPYTVDVMLKTAAPQDPCANHNHIDADSTARCQDNDGEADDYHGEAT